MSNRHSDIISQKGVKCPSVILLISKNHLDSWEEKISVENLGELSLGCNKYQENILLLYVFHGGKCLGIINC